MKLATRLARALREGTAETPCTVSIGVAWSSGDAMSADELVAAADNAMYQSKRSRKGEPKLA
jgi:PleD family two-component response regulator